MENQKVFNLKEFLRFLLVGGGATIVDYGIFYLFKLVILKNLDISLNLFISTFLGFTAGLIINWLFSAKFVYHYEKKTTNKQFIVYVILCVAGLALTELGILLGKPLYGTLMLKFIFEFDFWQLFFKCLMTVIVLIMNYFGRKYLVFK